MSSINMTRRNQFYFTLRPDGVYAFAGYQEPQLYYKNTPYNDSYLGRGRQTYMTLMDGSLALADSASGDGAYPLDFFQFSRWLQRVRFDSDGHLRLYEGYPGRTRPVQIPIRLWRLWYVSAPVASVLARWQASQVAVTSDNWMTRNQILVASSTLQYLAKI